MQKQECFAYIVSFNSHCNIMQIVSVPLFSGEGAQIKHVEQSVVQNGTRLVKGVDLELYIVSSNFTQTTYLIPTEYVHLRTTKKNISSKISATIRELGGKYSSHFPYMAYSRSLS